MTTNVPPSLVMFTDDASAYRGVMSNPDPYAQEPLTDEVLAEEIQLLGDVMTAATEHEGPLRDQDLDTALGT